MKFAIGHVVMPFIKYCGDVVTTPYNNLIKENDQFLLTNNNN